MTRGQNWTAPMIGLEMNELIRSRLKVASPPRGRSGGGLDRWGPPGWNSQLLPDFDLVVFQAFPRAHRFKKNPPLGSDAIERTPRLQGIIFVAPSAKRGTAV